MVTDDKSLIHLSQNNQFISHKFITWSLQSHDKAIPNTHEIWCTNCSGSSETIPRILVAYFLVFVMTKRDSTTKAIFSYMKASHYTVYMIAQHSDIRHSPPYHNKAGTKWLPFHICHHIFKLIFLYEILIFLTHWGRMTHICVSKLTITGSDSGLSPGRRQAIIVNWTLRKKLQRNVNRNSYIFIQENAFEGVVCEMASILSRPQCVNSKFINICSQGQGTKSR